MDINTSAKALKTELRLEPQPQGAGCLLKLTNFKERTFCTGFKQDLESQNVVLRMSKRKKNCLTYEEVGKHWHHLTREKTADANPEMDAILRRLYATVIFMLQEIKVNNSWNGQKDNK